MIYYNRPSSILSVLYFLVLGFILPGRTAADETPDHEPEAERGILGEWGGMLPLLERSGISSQLTATNDLYYNARGGKRTGGLGLGKIDWIAQVDTERAVGWGGGLLHLYLLGTYGGSPTDYSGDLQGTNNIEAFSTAKIFELWYEQSLFTGAISLLGGLFDYNSEFYSLSFAQTLIHPSFGIGPENAQAGPSIFPNTSLAARVRVELPEDGYLMAAAFDGVPGDPDHPAGTRIRLDEEDGGFWAAEAGIAADEASSSYFKTALGAWVLDRDFTDPSGQDRSGNSGLYLLLENTLYESEVGPGRRLGYFVQLGGANSDRNQIENYFGCGLTLYGPLAGRPNDVIAFGYARVGVDSLPEEGSPATDGRADVFELTYRLVVSSYLALQPDLMWIRNPEADPKLEDALALTLRAEANI